MAIRMLGHDKTKFVVLTTAPASPAAPTASELNAGIDASRLVSKAGFTFTASDSETISDPCLGSSSNSSLPTLSNYEVAFTFWRQFATGGGFDPAGDALFDALKTKGTELYAYARRTDKPATAAWANGDELYLGVKFVVDNLKATEAEGYIRYDVKGLPQEGWPFAVVGGTTGVPVVVSAIPSAQTTGKSLLIKGVKFTGTTAASLGGTAATNFTIVDDTTLLLTMPTGTAGSAPLVVTNATGASASFAYTRGGA